MTEKILHKQVCQYLRMQYPNVLFNSDMAGSMKLTIGQAVQIKSLRSNRGFPDIVIYEPRGICHGLFIELKNEGTKLYKKDNMTPTTPHILEQMEMQTELQQRGYRCSFAIGFDEAKIIIDNYLKP
jgi:hypothetical protein